MIRPVDMQHAAQQHEQQSIQLPRKESKIGIARQQEKVNS